MRSETEGVRKRRIEETRNQGNTAERRRRRQEDGVGAPQLKTAADGGQVWETGRSVS